MPVEGGSPKASRTLAQSRPLDGCLPAKGRTLRDGGKAASVYQVYIRRLLRFQR